MLLLPSFYNVIFCIVVLLDKCVAQSKISGGRSLVDFESAVLFNGVELPADAV